MSIRELVGVFALAAVVLGSAIPVSAAQETRDARRAKNCAYYREMIAHALEGIDGEALSPSFVEEHDAFVAGGCLATRPACPKSPADFAFADLLTMMTVSANMGSTFTPFWCPAARGG
ncbi:hypothetical protein [Roseibium marinum]|uniref:Uncharacterized protein n=1 Tax=Roseibium marinum TaxID=281252 RepID=A0A2S3UX78_9HYPH|nr:hypothetical protein [Roseibium marinum]POF32307.1 hypothetical protein CLV41_103230 [Roseibium marinum]